jgi:hypothetical protein
MARPQDSDQGQAIRRLRQSRQEERQLGPPPHVRLESPGPPAVRRWEAEKARRKLNGAYGEGKGKIWRSGPAEILSILRKPGLNFIEAIARRLKDEGRGPGALSRRSLTAGAAS